MTSREPDYYAVLNLPEESTIAAIREQYRRLVKVFHPDRNSGDAWCEEQLKQFNLAYQFFSDERRKAAYDERRRVRTSDAASFSAPFEKAVQDEPEPEPVNPWSFEADQRQKRADSEHYTSAPTNWPGMFSEATIASPSIQASAGLEQKKRSALIRYSIAIAAAIVLIVTLVVINTQPDSDPVSSISSSSISPASNAKADLGVGLPGAPISAPALVEPVTPISKEDDLAADSHRHEVALQLKKTVLPYWMRYRRVRPRAVQAADICDQALGFMQSQDKHSPEGEPKIGTLRYAAESKLWSDVKAMRDKLSSIDSEFDDLQYPSTDDDVNAELAQVDGQVKELENSTDPVFADLQAVTASSSKKISD